MFARVHVLACSLIKQLHFEQEREAWTADQSCRTKTLLIEPIYTTALAILVYGLRFALMGLCLSAVNKLESLTCIFYT